MDRMCKRALAESRAGCCPESSGATRAGSCPTLQLWSMATHTHWDEALSASIYFPQRSYHQCRDILQMSYHKMYSFTGREELQMLKETKGITQKLHLC